MISIDRIRNNFEEIKSSLLSKGYRDDLGEIVSIDKDYRHGLHRVNELRAERHKVSDEIAELKKKKQDANEKII